AAATFNVRGDYSFVLTSGARSVERIDELRQVQAGSILFVGMAPDGLAVTGDGRWLSVNSQLTRELFFYDLDEGFDRLPAPSDALSTVAQEPLGESVLLGKQLFFDAFDPRLSQDGYLACAHCHPDGRSDGLTWDFTARGEGLRNTTTLLGRAGDGDGPIHWTGNFDEIHDFENDIREAFSGIGLMSDDDYLATVDTLGPSKAGRSFELDALAAYSASLDTHLPSPYRDASGALDAKAQEGRAIFESAAAGCTACHQGPRLTDSQFLEPGAPLLHDVGTLRETSGSRLGKELTGLDTPTLHGLWDSAPYLHDGSAATLREVLVERNPDDTHGTTSSLDDDAIDALVHYLLSLDGRRD
ncbi:MAG: cytochrome c peroxidase, partial [Myxococcota bacterium]